MGRLSPATPMRYHRLRSEANSPSHHPSSKVYGDSVIHSHSKSEAELGRHRAGKQALEQFK